MHEKGHSVNRKKQWVVVYNYPENAGNVEDVSKKIAEKCAKKGAAVIETPREGGQFWQFVNTLERYRPIYRLDWFCHGSGGAPQINNTVVNTLMFRIRPDLFKRLVAAFEQDGWLVGWLCQFADLQTFLYLRDNAKRLHVVGCRGDMAYLSTKLDPFGLFDDHVIAEGARATAYNGRITNQWGKWKFFNDHELLNDKVIWP